MKNKKGFTLIELLAVIIILGVLMIIAIPSVTKYIEESRKSGYISTAKSLAGGVRNLIYSGSLDLNDKDATYYIDASCIAVDNGYKSPYGDFTKAYVVVTTTNDNYEYYWTSVDSSGKGVKNLINVNKLDSDNIETDITTSDISTLRTIDGRGKVILVTKENNCQKESTITENLIQIIGETGEEDKRVVTIVNAKPEVVNLAGANRYVGQNPNNFVRFNGNELWRIIGVYGSNIKIISTSSIPAMMYNENADKSNKWSGSDLQVYLNTTYYNTLTDSAKSMIYEGNWYVGKARSSDTREESYLHSKATLWTGKVGLLAAYEFLYASTKENCDDVSQGSYYNGCGDVDVDWLNPDTCCRLMTPSYQYNWEYNGGGITDLNTGGFLFGDHVRNIRDAYPVVYLKSSTKIISGTGTRSNPYILE